MSPYSHYLSSAVAVLAITATSVAAPVPDSLLHARSSSNPGTLTGSLGLVGPDGNLVNPADTAVVSDYVLVPGQSSSADNGLFLDFTSTPNPQPIRGQYGGTDPGPRTLFSLFCDRETDKTTQVNIDMI